MGMSGGPTFYGGHGEMIQKRAKGKTGMSKKLRRLLAERPSTGVVFAYDLEQACSKASRSALQKVARNKSLSRAERTSALMQLDSCACGTDAVAGKSAKITKSAKRLPKAERRRLEHDALFSPDIARRVRAMDALYGSLG
jgi:hypothetical protein